ncbi:MAG TPA: YciI family protein [Candidatus Acidoferrum sp.]|nr:YciI family protein [Candidatus Acidoferrum sp.]
MKFLSVYKTKESTAPPSPEEIARFGKLIEEGMKSGYLLAVEGCMPSAAGARVRLNAGTITVTDGPFSESKELIGGLAILQANSKAEAIEIARNFLRIAGDGECELRQLHEANHAPCQEQSAKAQA